MNIYAKKGDKVRCKGLPQDYNISIIKQYFKLNHVYTVEKTVVFKWHTNVYFQECPANMCFNSVFFEDIEEVEPNNSTII